MENFCGYCGRRIVAGAKYCVLCGKKLPDEAVNTTPGAAAQAYPYVRAKTEQPGSGKEQKEKKHTLVPLKVLLIVICLALVAAGIILIPANITAARQGKPVNGILAGSADLTDEEVEVMESGSSPEDEALAQFEYAAPSGENEENTMYKHDAYEWFFDDTEEWPDEEAAQEEEK